MTYQIRLPAVVQVSLPGQHDRDEQLLKMSRREGAAEGGLVPERQGKLRSLDVAWRLPREVGGRVHHVGDRDLDVALGHDAEGPERPDDFLVDTPAVGHRVGRVPATG